MVYSHLAGRSSFGLYAESHTVWTWFKTCPSSDQFLTVVSTAAGTVILFEFVYTVSLPLVLFSEICEQNDGTLCHSKWHWRWLFTVRQLNWQQPPLCKCDGRKTQLLPVYCVIVWRSTKFFATYVAQRYVQNCSFLLLRFKQQANLYNNVDAGLIQNRDHQMYYGLSTPHPRWRHHR